jgi:hypothetical protein
VRRKPQTRSELRKRNAAILKRLEEFKREVERRVKSPSARRAARLEWQRHIKAILLWAKNGYGSGHESALWDAVLFCEQTNTPKPAWVRDALERYAKDRVNARPFKKRMGRRSYPLLDVYIFELVNHWRNQHRIFRQKGKSRRFSYERAFERVKEELVAVFNHHLSDGALRAAYKRGKKILSEPDAYHASPFLEAIILPVKK